MSRGKYSPYSKEKFVPDHWETGEMGTTEVDKDGFDYYGYNADGKDAVGISEYEYLSMPDGEFEAHLMRTWGPSNATLNVRKLEDIKARLDDIAARRVWTHGECAVVAQELLNEFFGETK